MIARTPSPREGSLLERLRERLLHGPDARLPYVWRRFDGQIEWVQAPGEQARPAASATREPQERALAPCILVLPPGLPSLCQVVLAEDDAKAALEGLDAAAAAALLEDSERGYTERRAVRLDEQTRAVQGWVAAETLERMLGQIEAQGFEARLALAPEFCLGSAEPTILIYVEPALAQGVAPCIVYILYLVQRAPLLNQTAFDGGPSLGLCLKWLAAEIETQNLPHPTRALVWAQDGEHLGAQARHDALQAFPRIEVVALSSWSEALTRMQAPLRRGVFSAFLAQRERLPMSKELLTRLSVTTAVMLAGVVALLFALLSVCERDTEQLEREVQELKILAHRSSGAKQRIQDLSKKLTLIQRAAKEKPNVLMVLQAIERMKPHLVKVSDVTITRQGVLRITGQAKDKEYVAKFQHEMSGDAMFQDPRLESLETEAAAGEARFLLHALLPYWAEFFRVWDEGLKEANQAAERSRR